MHMQFFFKTKQMVSVSISTYYEFLISLPGFSIMNMTHQNELIPTYFNYNSFSLRKISCLKNRPSTEKSF